MPPMLKPRHAFCAAMVEGTIIALGGWNERTVEKYDFRNKQWSLLKDFPKQRDCIQGEVCEGVLYVFGGVKKNKNVSTIEKYDYERDSWRTVGQFMVPRLYSAVVVT
ncbi:actin-binding protein IPP-like [Bolinopsis microptera]